MLAINRTDLEVMYLAEFSELLNQGYIEPNSA